jgi:hypothetical protein
MASQPPEPEPRDGPRAGHSPRAADLPSHPERDDDPAVQSGRGSTSQAGWRTYLFVFLGVALVMVFVVLHLTGTLGPGGH